MTTFATFTPRRTLLATLIASLTVSAPTHAADVVINQLYAHSHSTSSNFGHDFVELFNRGSAPVSLDGMRVQYQSATGTTWSSSVALPPVTLAPGQYFLVRGAKDQGRNPIEVFDAQAPAMNMAGGTGKVAISDGTRLLDLVGYGSANLSEGTPAPSPTLEQSLQRAAAGCQDSDDSTLR